jgi:hypothetical protein
VLVAQVRQEHRQHVVPLGRGRVGTTAADLLVDERVDARDERRVPPPEALDEAVGLDDRQDEQPEGTRRLVEEPPQRVHQALHPILVLDAEHGAGHHLERDSAEARSRVELPACWPAGELARRDRLHDVAVGAHPLAVEGREHQLALGEMRRPVEQEERLLPERGLEDPVALARPEQLRIAPEHLPDGGGIGHEHHGRRRRQPQREGLAVARPAVLEKRKRLVRPACGLAQGRGGRTARERASHSRHCRVPVPRETSRA